MKECNLCGKCCIKYSNGGLSVTSGETELWRIFRPDIFEYVRNGIIWISPETGQKLDRCPWLKKLPGEEKYVCDIYLDRPDDCKYYPVTVAQMIDDDCEMLEETDLRGMVNAQKKLDIIMADSRPAVGKLFSGSHGDQ